MIDAKSWKLDCSFPARIIRVEFASWEE